MLIVYGGLSIYGVQKVLAVNEGIPSGNPFGVTKLNRCLK